MRIAWLLVVLAISNGFLAWNVYRSEESYGTMKAAADRCLAALEDYAARPAFSGSTTGIPQGWGLPVTCDVGSLAQDLNHPEVLYVCHSHQGWMPFPFVKAVPHGHTP